MPLHIYDKWQEGNFYPAKDALIGTREAQPEEDSSVAERLARLKTQHEETGIRRSVDAVMVVMDHGLPHLLVLQVASGFFKLPGGYLDPTENDTEGLSLRLQEQLGIPLGRSFGTQLSVDGNSVQRANGFVSPGWKITDLLGVWWRPHFDTYFYPYLPAHVTDPKEIKKLYLVELPEKSGSFAFASDTASQLAYPPFLESDPDDNIHNPNMKLHSVPIFEFYDNAARYGPILASLPGCLNRYMVPAHTDAIENATEHTRYAKEGYNKAE